MSIQRDSSNKTKLNQIVQQYFSKAAQIIVQSRISVTPLYVKGTATPKLNKWFNLELEETETFRDDLRLWKTADPEDATIPPLVVETFLDLRDLPAHQNLVLVDSKGKSWTVTKGTKRTEVVLERWIIEVSDGLKLDQHQELPTIYKQVIILMRSLYTYTRLIPAWSLKNKLLKSKSNFSPISIGCRVLNGSHGISSKGRIGLNRRVKDSTSEEIEAFSFDEIRMPLGTLKATVTYRTECDFIIRNNSNATSPSANSANSSSADVNPTNTALSITTDFNIESDNGQNDFKSSAVAHRSSVSSINQGSLPSPSKSSIEGNSYMASRHNVYKNHTKNYSSDFVTTDSFGDQFIPRDRRFSAVSLREGLAGSSGASSGSLPQNMPSTSPSATVSSQAVSSPIATKHSVSFIQPFKTPSLSASPSSTDVPFSFSGTPSSRPQSFSRTTSNSSLSALAALRNPIRTTSNASNTSSAGSYIKNVGSMHQNSLNENAISSSASSSRSGSVSRYSSSFGSRTGQWARTSSISGARPKHLFTGDPSSFGSSTSSVNQPGSGFLMTDEDDLSAFLKTIDSISYGKDSNNSSSILLGMGSNEQSLLMSQPRFDTTSSGSSNTNVHPAGSESGIASTSDLSDDRLSRFRHLKESHSALSDSMHSSQISKSDGSPLSGSGGSGTGSQNAGQHVSSNSGGSSSATSSPSQGVFSFAMSPPSIQKTGSAHTPSIPSRLSEEYTPDDTYKIQYNSHPRKHGSRSGSLAIDEGIYLHADHGADSPSSKDEQNISSSARTGALDIPRTHVSRVQRRESLSFSNRHTSGYKDMQDALVVNNTSTHHQSLSAFGHILPVGDLSNLRPGNNAIASSGFQTQRRYSSDFLPHEAPISSFNHSQSRVSSGGSSFTNSSSRKMSSFLSSANNNSNHSTGASGDAGHSSGNSNNNSIANSGNIHHQLEALPGNFRQQVSLGGGDHQLHSHHLNQHHITPSSASVRSRRFSYCLPDDDEEDDSDGEDKSSLHHNAAESMVNDDDVFFFAMNEDDDAGINDSSTGGGSGAGGVSGAGNGTNVAPGENNDSSSPGGGIFGHSSSNRYDPLTWK